MIITLRPEQEKLIALAMQSGAYQDPHEVIERALEMLRLEDEWLHDHRGDIAQKIDRAFDQFDRGDFLTSDQSRADMESRKAALLRDQPR
jgi:hypothetical protein